MKKSLIITIQLIIFAALATIAILYIMERSPVEDLGHYEKQEMARPNKDSSVIDQFFSPKSKDEGYGDDVSLTGGSGRYDEVRIGKAPEDQ